MAIGHKIQLTNNVKILMNPFARGFAARAQSYGLTPLQSNYLFKKAADQGMFHNPGSLQGPEQAPQMPPEALAPQQVPQPNLQQVPQLSPEILAQLQQLMGQQQSAQPRLA